MMENAYYSVISPEGCAAILWKDRKHAEDAAEALKLSAPDLYKMGIVDEVIAEPLGGAHHDYIGAANALKTAVRSHLLELEKVEPEALLQQRYEKFRQFGEFKEKN